MFNAEYSFNTRKSMSSIYLKVRALQNINTLSKHEQLVKGMIDAIDDKLIFRGDRLPSVNQMISELGFARETIVKAYKELINRGIIESKNRHGYYVLNDATEQVVKIALILYAFDNFQENFYRNFREALGANVQLDVFFHHNNIEIFESILINIQGKYGMHVVAPIPDPKAQLLLNKMAFNKFLMIDRYVPLKGDYSFLVQEFEKSSYNIFVELIEEIRKYDEFVFFFKKGTAEPVEILRAFKKFIKNFGLNGRIAEEYIPGTITKGTLYFTIHNPELYAIIKDAITQGFTLGRDIGLLSHNDDIVKEIISGGITTFSTDFGEMGKMAATFVLSRVKIQMVLPMKLLRRGSL